MKRLIGKINYVLSAPLAIYIILDSPKVKLSFFEKYRLGLHMFLNSIRIKGVSYKAILAMAVKVLETEADGIVIECGTYKGGSAVNLSLACRIAGRKLHIYDSFKGIPKHVKGDRQVYPEGAYRGTLYEVKRNIRKYGAIEYCEFHPGWFKDTLPLLKVPVVLAFLDVDIEASLDTCVRYIWPNLVEGGFIFTDECVSTDYTALFYSEKWWRDNFNITPPGLVGAGTGLPLGGYYIGLHEDREKHPMQTASTGGYTFKGMSGYWSFYPGCGK